MLPAPLKDALDRRLDGVSRSELARRSQRISELYRSGSGSTAAIRDELDVLAYAIARMPATMAAVTHALRRTFEHAAGFAPASLLDLGAGPGGSAIGALDQCPSIIRTTLVESHPAFRTFAAAMFRACNNDAHILPVDLVQDRAKLPDADLVLASYVLVEIPEAHIADIATRAFAPTTGLLLLVEPGTPEGFKRIRLARDVLIAHGGRVIAPCPGSMSCPMTGGDWCHFSVRVQRSREHKLVKRADVPFEDERFCYIAVAKGASSTWNAPASSRILREPHAGSGGVSLQLCTTAGVGETLIARRDQPRFKAARKLKWGDAYDFNVTASAEIVNGERVSPQGASGRPLRP